MKNAGEKGFSNWIVKNTVLANYSWTVLPCIVSLYIVKLIICDKKCFELFLLRHFKTVCLYSYIIKNNILLCHILYKLILFHLVQRLLILCTQANVYSKTLIEHSKLWTIVTVWAVCWLIMFWEIISCKSL